MITIDNEQHLDYKEAANMLHCTYSYLRNLISSGEIPSRPYGAGKKKYIPISAINKRLNPYAPTANSVIVPVPFPIESQALQAIQLINNEMADRSQVYERLASPLIKTVKDTDTQAFLDILSKVLQNMFNKLYAIKKPIAEIPITDLMMYLMDDVPMPDSFKHRLISDALSTANEIAEQLTLTDKSVSA